MPGQPPSERLDGREMPLNAAGRRAPPAFGFQVRRKLLDTLCRDLTHSLPFSFVDDTADIFQGLIDMAITIAGRSHLVREVDEMFFDRSLGLFGDTFQLRIDHSAALQRCICFQFLPHPISRRFAGLFRAFHMSLSFVILPGD